MNLKNMISLSKFFASGGELREWKRGLNESKRRFKKIQKETNSEK
jgi:hypothetical protein